MMDEKKSKKDKQNEPFDFNVLINTASGIEECRDGGEFGKFVKNEDKQI